MKIKYIIIAFITVLCGVMISCEDFVQEEPKGLLTPDNFFGNEAEAILALNGLQADVPAGGGIGSICGTDIGVIGRSAIPGGWITAVYMHDVTASGSWASSYASVKNANLVIAGLERSSLPDAIKNRAMAQALFYRAVFYFGLTTDYGDAVYWRDELVMEDVAFLGKTDANVIQQGMIEDLEYALSLNALPTGKWSENNALPTEWSVRMLKAYFHIWQEEWPEARTELIEVTQNSPHELNPDYADMYRQGNELHDEIVFGKEFFKDLTSLTNRSHEGFHYNAAAENAATIKAMKEVDVFARSASQTLRKSFAATYDDNDARKRYNVWDSYTLADGTEAVFNCIYIPKMMRSYVPVGDPLMQESDANWSSGEPGRTFLLSDAWLLLAEADFMANGGTSQVALDAINEVRERTTLPLYTSITMEDIRNERSWELCAEGFMGHKKDLIRWGMLESTVLATPAAEIAAGAYSVSIERAEAEAAAIAGAPIGKWQYFPIPLSEIQRSEDIGGALVQNPFWE
jgi:hypothetical protein